MLMQFKEWPEKDRSDLVVLRALLCVLELKRELTPQAIANIPSLSELIDTADRVAKNIGWGEDTDFH